jgi:hypothetical protein
MIVLDLSILNQKGTPMFNSDTLANRPAAGIVGRIFIAIDSPFGIYRDTGSAWDQISGASTFSGSLATGQVAFGSATNTISGTNNLFWDNANQRLGIGTNTPTRALDITRDVNDTLAINITNANNGNACVSTLLATASTGQFTLQAFGSGFTPQPSNNIINSSVRLRSSLGMVNGMYIITAGEAPMIFGTNDTQRLRIFGSSGNVLIQNGGTFTDGGQRLQVIGDAFIKGSGATSATIALQIQNSSSQNILQVFNDGMLKFGNANNAPLLYTGGGPTINSQALTIGLNNYNSWGNGESAFTILTNTNTTTAGTSTANSLTGTFAPGSGSHNHNFLRITATINQTGGANGITRGLFIQPFITSAAADWRSIEWSNSTGWGLYGAGTALNYLGGTLGIKTTSPYSPSTFSLDVNGGLLVKNTAGTTAQITLINANPALGGNEGFLVTSVGGTSGTSYAELQGYYGTSITGSTALRLNPAGGAVIINSTTNSGEQFQLTGTLRINGQQSATSGGNSGQHLIINLDGTTYKIKLELP